MGRNIRVRTWEEFKRLANEEKPRSIVYIISQSIPAKDLTGLKLILPGEKNQYLFTDSAKGKKLRKTGIPIHTDEKGIHLIKDEDVISFIRTQLQRDDLQIHSYWTI